MDLNMSNTEMARKIAELVSRQGGRVFYVGGYVRDRLSGIDSDDVDIEVHGISPSQLEEILDTLGQRIAVGESFGIYNLKGCPLDIAMPRKEELRGRGHRDFDIIVDPFIGTKAAARRRDFTFNAMMQDVLTGEIIDHFGGREDLRRGILRHVCSDSFGEDPLRVLRCAQFAARFEFEVAPETTELCRGMELFRLARERVMAELEKALLKADRPSVFFEVLREMGQLGYWFKELEALIGVPQNPVYHGEGDVWTHTMLVLDQAAKLRCRVDKPLWFMLSALCHDMGKALCTREIEGVIHAYEHERLGLPVVEGFLARMTSEAKLIKYVLNLTEYHMKPNTAAWANSAEKVTMHMFDSSLDPEGLLCLALADDMGRIGPEPGGGNQTFLNRRLEKYRELMARPHVQGRDLVEAGLEPGEYFSEALAYAHKLRLAGVDKESALKQTLGHARKLMKKQK